MISKNKLNKTRHNNSNNTSNNTSNKTRHKRINKITYKSNNKRNSKYKYNLSFKHGGFETREWGNNISDYLPNLIVKDIIYTLQFDKNNLYNSELIHNKLIVDRSDSSTQYSLLFGNNINLIANGSWGNVYKVLYNSDIKTDNYELAVAKVQLTYKDEQMDNLHYRMLNSEFLLEQDTNLEHPNIIKTLQSFETLYYENFRANFTIMEYMDIGGARNEIFKSLNNIELNKVVFYITRCVFKSIQHLHSLDYFHRDIKPENILLNSNGEVKLADLGFSTYDENLITGTPGYMYTSHHSGYIHYGSYGHHCDYWSLAMSMLELRFGVDIIYNLDRIYESLIFKFQQTGNNFDMYSFKHKDLLRFLFLSSDKNKTVDKYEKTYYLDQCIDSNLSERVIKMLKDEINIPEYLKNLQYIKDPFSELNEINMDYQFGILFYYLCHIGYTEQDSEKYDLSGTLPDFHWNITNSLFGEILDNTSGSDYKSLLFKSIEPNSLQKSENNQLYDLIKQDLWVKSCENNKNTKLIIDQLNKNYISSNTKFKSQANKILKKMTSDKLSKETNSFGEKFNKEHNIYTKMLNNNQSFRNELRNEYLKSIKPKNETVSRFTFSSNNNPNNNSPNNYNRVNLNKDVRKSKFVVTSFNSNNNK